MTSRTFNKVPSVSNLLFLLMLSLIFSCCSLHKENTALKEGDENYRNLLMEQIKSDNDPDSRLALARLDFDYHDYKGAKEILSALVNEFPHQAEYEVWYGANNCKLAGAMFPWFLGMEKLMPVHRCLNQIEGALAQDPLSYPVLMVMLSTSYEVDMFGSMTRALAATKVFDEHLKKERGKYAKRDLAQYYYIAARIARAKGEQKLARDYLNLIIVDNADQSVIEKARAELKQLDNA